MLTRITYLYEKSGRDGCWLISSEQRDQPDYFISTILYLKRSSTEVDPSYESFPLRGNRESAVDAAKARVKTHLFSEWVETPVREELI